MSAGPGRQGPGHFLIVDDDSGDVLLLREAFKACRWRHSFSVVEDGEAAMSFLRREKPYETAARPDLVLLDLNMPRKDGREVLAELKASPDLRRIPVIVLSTSNADRDVLDSYDLHANSYVVKPNSLDEYGAIARGIEEHWLGSAILPAR